MRKLLGIILVVSFGLVSCTDDSVSNTGSGDNGDNGSTNYNPSFSFTINGNTLKMGSSTNDYGGKLFIFATKEGGGNLVDFAIPVDKDETASNIPFDYVDSDGTVKGIFWYNGDQWGLKGPGLSVTKHTDNRISGTFSGKAYQLDYSGTTVQLVDSAQVTNGVFADLKVND